MSTVALVGILDARGWLLMQERDDRTPVDPDRWSLVGSGIEPGEAPDAAALRELAEETGIDTVALTHLGAFDVPCPHHGSDAVELYAARTTLTDGDVACHEGRQIVFVDPSRIAGLDLAEVTRHLYGRVLDC